MKDVDPHDSLTVALPDRFPVLVVDDDQSVLDVTRLVLNRYRFEGRGVECLEATSADEAYEILESRDDIAVLLLDVVMEEDDAGLRLVELVRRNLNNQRLRIILRTGQAGFAPEYRVVQNYDINDYLAKSESTQERLYVSLTTALRGYRDILAANIYARRALEAEKEREVAARALEAKTRFLAHLSHEIRNPLTGMLGIVELLEDSPTDEARDGLVRDLGYTVHTLLGVVDDVLDVAKIEAGRLKLHQQVFNTRHWLERTIGVYAASMQQKGVRLSTEIDDSVPERLVGDAARLRQILMNFLSNATKFTPENGEVVVRMAGTYNLTDFVLFVSVRDTGIGIPQAKMDDIFQPYEQGQEDIARLYGGSGLGLSLCHNLAELMGGSVGVMSRQERGSTFWVEVPLKAAVSVVSGMQSPGCTLKVAVCEDDATNRKTLQVILEKRGFCVQVYSDGSELLADSSWRQADIILMDCHMPNMNGVDTTIALRNAGCVVPVVALTAGVTDAERQACLDAGMDGVMAKPVDFSVLHEQLLAHVSHGRHPVRVAE